MDGSKLPQTTWRKSRRSNNGGNCVDVADLAAKIGVRDSKAPNTGHLVLSMDSWEQFMAAVRSGRYDLP